MYKNQVIGSNLKQVVVIRYVIKIQINAIILAKKFVIQEIILKIIAKNNVKEYFNVDINVNNCVEINVPALK